MKRYLARLAERATLPTPAVAPIAEPAAVADPFETVAPAETAPVTPSAPRVDEPAVVSRETPMPPIAAPRVEETHTTEKIETVTRERVVEKDVETMRPPAPPSPPKSEAPLVEEPVSLQPLPPEPVVATREKQTTIIEERRVVEEQREQQQLLRKADAFMSEILDRRPPASPPPARDELTIEPRVEREPAQRLQPPATPQPLPQEPAPEPPSLVIGKLTVEIVPSAPGQPARQQRPSVIVVRGARGAGRPAFPSSRRFGIGQF